MGSEHLMYPVVRQGKETMACWAACLSWYSKAVRHLNFSMEEIANRYAHLMDAPKDGNMIGGMDDAQRAQMLRDPIWQLDYSGSDRNFIDQDIKLFMSSGPVLFTYWDKTLNKGVGGSHMNVIVCKVENSDQYKVMDPDYGDYQIRNLMYYTQNSTKFHLASMRVSTVSVGW